MSWPAVHKHKFGLKFCFSTLSFERFDRETPSKFCIKQYYLPFTMNGIFPCSVHIISFDRFDRETPSKFCIKQYYLPFTMNGISPCSVHIIIDSKQFPYLVDPKIIKL